MQDSGNGRQFGFQNRPNWERYSLSIPTFGRDDVEVDGRSVWTFTMLPFPLETDRWYQILCHSTGGTKYGLDVWVALDAKLVVMVVWRAHQSIRERSETGH